MSRELAGGAHVLAVRGRAVHLGRHQGQHLRVLPEKPPMSELERIVRCLLMGLVAGSIVYLVTGWMGSEQPWTGAMTVGTLTAFILMERTRPKK